MKKKFTARPCSPKILNPFYDSVLNKLKENDDRISCGVLSKQEDFMQAITFLNFSYIEKEMKLITTSTVNLYFPFVLDIKKYNLPEFKNIEKEFLNANGELDGKIIWEKFTQLNEIKNFSKKAIRRYKLNALMQFFTFTIFSNETNQLTMGENLYGFYYIEDYSDFITDEGKFNRQEFNNQNSSQFF